MCAVKDVTECFTLKPTRYQVLVWCHSRKKVGPIVSGEANQGQFGRLAKGGESALPSHFYLATYRPNVESIEFAHIIGAIVFHHYCLSE